MDISNTVAVISAIVLLVAGLFAGMVFVPTSVVEVEKPCAPCAECPVCPEITANEQISEIHTEIFEDELWEDEAEALATAEWTERDYKDVYKAIDDIDDREDIEYVKVKESKVGPINVDDKDARVKQLLKVRYEDADGQDQKIYFVVITDIEDGEIENQNFTLEYSDFEL